MHRIAVGGIVHETNTFSPIPTRYEDFANAGGYQPEMYRGEDIFKFREGRFNIPSSGFLAAAEELNFEIVPLLWCGAEPSTPVSEEEFDRILGMFTADLSAGLPVDGVYLDLHGAMVYGDHKDAETEILRRVRGVVGDTPVVASLDLHGNITPESFELASAMVAYRTYPHVDEFETGERAAYLLNHLLGSKPLFKAFRQSPFLMPATRQSTLIEPCKSLYALIDELEGNPAVISVSILSGFNAVDIRDTGPSFLAYGVTQTAADRAVEAVLKAALEREAQFTVSLLQPDAAVKKAMKLARRSRKPVILADLQDNTGGGSSSDTVWILDSLVRHDARDAALGLLYDPDAAAAAHAAGEGTEVTLDLGGKLIPGQHPYHGTFQVEKVFEGDFMGTGPMVKGRTFNFGRMAQLRIGGVRVVVSSDRMQALDQSFFRVVGIEPKDMKILVLKSANHYRADFGLIAGEIINVDAPGGIVEDPSRVPYKYLRDGVRLKGHCFSMPKNRGDCCGSDRFGSCRGDS